MSNIAVKVENLGKKYIIGHKKAGDLRASIGDKFRHLFSKNGSSKEEFWALKDVSFEIKKGEAVGIIGRNGAGKSTLLKLLSRITDPSTGRFEINGRVSSLLEVGTGFHPELSGRENIFLNGTILGMRRSEIKAKFDEIVDFSGVEKFIDTPVKHYSSGMKVRLAFSVAAHLEPEILIVDEVLAVGDAEFQKKCLGKMDQVSKNEGRTVLFVSHNMGAMETLCNTGLLLNEGTVHYLGDITDSIKLYSHLNKGSLRDVDTGLFDLQNHSNKTYDRNYGLLSVRVLVEGKETNVVGTGDNLEFQFSYILKERIENPVLGFVIKDIQGQPIFGINNKHLNQILKNDLSGVISIGVEDFSLYGNGELNVDIYFGNQGFDFDIIKDAFSLELIAKDVYRSGFLLNPKFNRIYIPKITYSNL